jgi:thioredoxin 1
MTTALDKNTFDEFINSSNTPVLVDFYAPWCTPCTKISPMLDELAPEMVNEVTFSKLNIDENEDFPPRYNFASIPALLVFDGGNLIGRVSISGGFTKDSLREKIRAVLAGRGQ